MNKIKVSKQKCIEKTINSDIVINDYSKLKGIKEDTLFIYIPENKHTNLEITINEDDAYQDIYVLIDKNSSLNLYEYKSNANNKKYHYYYHIKEDSSLISSKFYIVDKIDEKVEIDLDGINASIDYNFATISSNNQRYITDIRHNYPKTKCYLNNRGITLDKSRLEFEVNDYIPKGMKDSIAKQDNKIIMMEDNDSIIKPNLYIDEYEVEAKHGASIGKFDLEELFYLQSRGLTELESYHLLMKSFILGIMKVDKGIQDSITQVVNDYRR
jgi:hypothetical protein